MGNRYAVTNGMNLSTKLAAMANTPATSTAWNIQSGKNFNNHTSSS
jgi:hypothetical protein